MSHYLPLLEDNRRALPPLLKPGALLHSVEQKGKEMKLRHPHMKGIYKELFTVVFLMIPPLVSPNVLCLWTPRLMKDIIIIIILEVDCPG